MSLEFKCAAGTVRSLASSGLHCVIPATLLLLGGCDQSDSNARRNVGNLPPVHVDQTVELLLEGSNSARDTYQRTLRNCQAAGMQSRALPEVDVARVGVTRYEAWFEPTREVIRERSWQVVNDGPAGTCLFRLEMTGLQETTTAQRYEQLDLATGERSVQPSAPDALSRVPAEREEEEASMGFEGPERKTVSGQACNEWVNRSSAFRQCVWAGGAAWGFTSGGLNDHRPRRDFIVLEQTPLSGQGYKVTTTSITVGQAFDAALLQSPSSGDGRY